MRYSDSMNNRLRTLVFLITAAGVLSTTVLTVQQWRLGAGDSQLSGFPFVGTALAESPANSGDGHAAEGKGAEGVLPAEEVLDLKPHYSPIAAIELFVTNDCKSCLKAQLKVNGLEESTGNRRGRVIFLTYNITRSEAASQTGERAVSLSRERIQKRWNDYGVFGKQRNRPLPQLVVNGRKYLASTPNDTIEHAIDLALAKPSKFAISLELGKVRRESVSVRYSVEGLPKARSDDLYVLTIVAIRPHVPVPIYSVDGVDMDEVYANDVVACDTLRIEADDSGEVELQIDESIRGEVKDFAALFQDARSGVLVSGETLRVKLPPGPKTESP